ncbi:MAG: CorA family divalent cation transporter [Desulfopila sp.]|nr:CorA family divalent cation transporter [Desulfopila sp.]
MIHAVTRLYLRDLYEHTIRLIDTVEVFRDMVSGLLDTCLSSLRKRMNEVMKVLPSLPQYSFLLVFLLVFMA